MSGLWCSAGLLLLLHLQLALLHLLQQLLRSLDRSVPRRRLLWFGRFRGILVGAVIAVIGRVRIRRFETALRRLLRRGRIRHHARTGRSRVRTALGHKNHAGERVGVRGRAQQHIVKV